jgi:hypothetical protein
LQVGVVYIVLDGGLDDGLRGIVHDCTGAAGGEGSHTGIPVRYKLFAIDKDWHLQGKHPRCALTNHKTTVQDKLSFRDHCRNENIRKRGDME